jgi:acetoin utilization deacetylase AcuC-like enzyme
LNPGGGLYVHQPTQHGHDPGDHPDRPERVEVLEAALARVDWLGYERREAPAVDLDVLCAVHEPAYVDRVRALCAAGGARWDPDTALGPGSYEAALRAAGGACALVEALLRGEADVGFAAVRPPGHHAGPTSAAGFCIFNSVAVAARHALDHLGVRRVLVLDWDVHHGNGTHDVFRRSPEVLFASIHRGDLYPATGELRDCGSGPGEGYAINLPVPAGSDEEVWLSLLEHVICPAALAFAPELVLVSAGFDAHRDDPLGGCLLEAESFGEMARHVRELGAPVAAVLEGGYEPTALAASVAATLAGLAGDRPADSIAPEMIYTPRAAAWVAHHWPV